MRTDAALVHEILSELISNSATFTPRGGTITLSGRPLPDGNVELAVTDSGPGIRGRRDPRASPSASPAARPRRGSPAPGLGLGVATALAERLGGRLTVAAGPDGKARLELPAALARRRPRRRRGPQSSPEPAATP